jgi:hypothetical protein
MLSLNREHQIILNFGPDTHRDGAMKVHALHLDCKTVLSHWQAVESLETLRKMLHYLGASDEQMMSFENSLRRWGSGVGACAAAARPTQPAAHRLLAVVNALEVLLAPRCKFRIAGDSLAIGALRCCNRIGVQHFSASATVPPMPAPKSVQNALVLLL